MTPEVMAKLKVYPENGGLTVDALDLMATRNDVRFWLLSWSTDDSLWHHSLSATSGPLSEMLRSIAGCYSVTLS